MSREDILKRIRENKPVVDSLPDLSVFQHQIDQEMLIKDFIRISTGNMSNVVNVIGAEIPVETYLKGFIAENFPTAKTYYDTLHPEKLNKEIDFGKTPVDLFIGEAKLGVAENGCLWLDESILTSRVSAFACEHSLLVIDHKNIVPTMHQAYKKLNIRESGYAVFVAGPSKTADIEQSLVVGAQGAVSNTVILI